MKNEQCSHTNMNFVLLQKNQRIHKYWLTILQPNSLQEWGDLAPAPLKHGRHLTVPQATRGDLPPFLLSTVRWGVWLGTFITVSLSPVGTLWAGAPQSEAQKGVERPEGGVSVVRRCIIVEAPRNPYRFGEIFLFVYFAILP